MSRFVKLNLTGFGREKPVILNTDYILAIEDDDINGCQIRMAENIGDKLISYKYSGSLDELASRLKLDISE